MKEKSEQQIESVSSAILGFAKENPTFSTLILGALGIVVYGFFNRRRQEFKFGEKGIEMKPSELPKQEAGNVKGKNDVKINQETPYESDQKTGDVESLDGSVNFNQTQGYQSNNNLNKN